MNLFVARLSSSTTGDDLKEIFSAYGEVTGAKVIFDRETGNSKCFGFVEMPDMEAGNAAIAALNDSEVDGKQILVKESAPREERPRRERFSRGGDHQRRDDRRSGDRRGGGLKNRDR